MVGHVIERGLPRHSILNINLPDRPLAGITGIRPARLGGASAYDYVMLAGDDGAAPDGALPALRAPGLRRVGRHGFRRRRFRRGRRSRRCATTCWTRTCSPTWRAGTSTWSGSVTGLRDTTGEGRAAGAPLIDAAGFDPVVFDLDGTVVDTVELIVESFRHATRTVLDEALPDEVILAGVGQPLMAQMRRLSAEHAQELYDVYREYNHRRHDELIRGYEGVAEVLDALRAAGRRLGIVTSKSADTTQMAFRAVGLREHFEVVVTASDTDRAQAVAGAAAPVPGAPRRAGGGRAVRRRQPRATSRPAARPAWPPRPWHGACSAARRCWRRGRTTGSTQPGELLGLCLRGEGCARRSRGTSTAAPERRRSAAGREGTTSGIGAAAARRPPKGDAVSEAEAAARAAGLRETINRHAHLYYVLDRPEIDDAGVRRAVPRAADPRGGVSGAAHGGLADAARRRRAARGVHAGTVTSSRCSRSPTPATRRSCWRGTSATGGCSRRRELDDAPLRYVVEPKIDGLAISLTYRDGVFSVGATRGNGEIGEEVTANLRTIGSVPLRLLVSDPPPVVEVRGEVYLPLAAFARLNEQRLADGLSAFVNPRNSAAGSIRQLDPRLAAARPLDVLVLRHRLLGGTRPARPPQRPGLAAGGRVQGQPADRHRRRHRAGRRGVPLPGRSAAASSTTTSTARWSRSTRSRIAAGAGQRRARPALGDRLQVRADHGDDEAAQHRGQRGEDRRAHAVRRARAGVRRRRDRRARHAAQRGRHPPQGHPRRRRRDPAARRRRDPAGGRAGHHRRGRRG